MGQPHSHRRPRESKAPSPAPSPTQPSSQTVPAVCGPPTAGSAGRAALGGCTGSTHSCQAQPADSGSSEGRWQRECRVSGKERGMKETCSSAKGTCQRPPTAIPRPGERAGCCFDRANGSEGTSPVLSPGLNRINKSWWVVVCPPGLL